jgi:hypothetical protein
MALSFCTHCGNKMTYSVSPPNFCGKCGTKLTATASVKATAPIKRAEDDFEDEDSEEFSSVSEIPSISSFAYEIENDSGNRSYQLGELFGQPKTFSRRNRPMSLNELKDKHAKT